MLSLNLINSGSQILKKNKIKSHLLDSELILSRVLNKKRESLLIEEEFKVLKKDVKNFKNLINRRVNNEPLSYIFKKKEFWKYEFYVNKSTLIPRPETELLVEKITNLYKGTNPLILDIGTGSGCIIISLLKELRGAKGVGLDISSGAIKVAKKNVKKFKIKSRVKLLNKSIDYKFNCEFDLIVSNPPYISSKEMKNLAKDIKNFEPKIALDGGNDGLDVVRKVIYKASSILKFKGMLALEIGNGQYKKVSQILRKKSFKEKFLIKDYNNNIRCILSNLIN